MASEIIELLRRHEGVVFVNEDGIEDYFRLMPPMPDSEIRAFEATLPCALPSDMHDLLRFARGFEGVLDGIYFAGIPGGGIGLETFLPHALPVAADGYGNFWVLDLTSESQSWSPVFYACHDAPVIVHQTASFPHFVEECIRFANKPWKSEIDDVHEIYSHRIWRENPGVLSFADCLASGDTDLMAFAQSLDPSWQFIDLRKPRLGDGFSWGRYGWRTENRRFGEKRIFAYQVKSWRTRLREAIFG